MMFARAEDREVLAAEYVLGTLDDDERVQAQALTILDPDFAATIKSWERRFGELHVMLAPVDPPAGTFERIKAQLQSTEKIEEIWLPETEPLPVPVPAAVAAAEAIPATAAERHGDALPRVRAWRRLALLLVLIGVLVAAFTGLRTYRPDLLPPELRPQVIEKIVEVPVGSARPAHYVAVLQKEPFAPAFLVTFDLARTTLVVRMLAAKPPAGQSYQLWMISDQFGPRSLGVIGSDEYLVRTSIAAFDPATLYRASYGISLEPNGGSPTGKPTGPMLYTGRLSATTPVGFPEQSP
jgi:anti-sigma-K factor RskA